MWLNYLCTLENKVLIVSLINLMLNKLKCATLVGLVGTCGVLSASPAHAAWQSCTATGAFGFLNSLAVGDSCQVGDKNYVITAKTLTSNNGFGTVQIGNQTSDTHTLTVNDASGFTGSGIFNYTVTAVASELINAFKFGNTSSGLSAAYTITADLNPSFPWTVTQNQNSPTAMTPLPNLSFLNVNHTYTQVSPSMTSFTDTISQTPGPLPLVGTGLAFGFTRKLRKRITAAA